MYPAHHQHAPDAIFPFLPGTKHPSRRQLLITAGGSSLNTKPFICAQRYQYTRWGKKITARIQNWPPRTKTNQAPPLFG
jgi:hypothetical protein